MMLLDGLAYICRKKEDTNANENSRQIFQMFKFKGQKIHPLNLQIFEVAYLGRSALKREWRKNKQFCSRNIFFVKIKLVFVE